MATMVEPTSDVVVLSSISIKTSTRSEPGVSSCHGISNESFVVDDESEQFPQTNTEDMTRSADYDNYFIEIDLTEQQSDIVGSSVVSRTESAEGTIDCGRNLNAFDSDQITNGIRCHSSCASNLECVCELDKDIGNSSVEHFSSYEQNCDCVTEHQLIKKSNSLDVTEKFSGENAKNDNIARGIILQIVPDAENRARGRSKDNIENLTIMYDGNLFDAAGSSELNIYPPPSYRSIIEKTIADAPPSYHLVTGIKSNVDEVVEEVEKKRGNSSRNWGDITISRSGRLLILLILVVTLVIGSILILLAVLN